MTQDPHHDLPLFSEEKVIRLRPDGTWESISDAIAVEEPLEIQWNEKTVAITMRTPGNDPELVTGFLLTESIITQPEELLSIQRCPLSNHPNRIQITLAKTASISNEGLKRYGTISSSCGICGKQSIDEVLRTFAPIEQRLLVDLKTILQLPETFSQHQSTFQNTGGLHAAALFQGDGKLLTLREDVGRHNAVDKVIGWAAQNNHWPPQQTILMVSGRISFEIMQKALAARIPIIVGVSAPSTLALTFARQSDQTLIGFLRPPRFNVYSHIESIRIDLPE